MWPHIYYICVCVYNTYHMYVCTAYNLTIQDGMHDFTCHVCGEHYYRCGTLCVCVCVKQNYWQTPSSSVHTHTNLILINKYYYVLPDTGERLHLVLYPACGLVLSKQ